MKIWFSSIIEKQMVKIIQLSVSECFYKRWKQSFKKLALNIYYSW